MKTSFISHALILRDLFDTRFRFTIPLYQRPYSWSIDEASKLLDDLVNAMGDESGRFNFDTYFLGAIILTSSSQKTIGGRPGDASITDAFTRVIAVDHDPAVDALCEFEIVDGKQRLITLQILLCLLRDLADDAARPDFDALIGDNTAATPYHLVLSGGERQFLNECVLEPGSTLRDVSIDGLPNSQKNIKLVRDSLHETLNELGGHMRGRLLSYILKHCEIVVILTEEFDNAYQIFLSINDTGSPLVQGDILKVELMTKIDRNLRAQYQTIWETWNDSLGEPETRHGVKKTFFNHFWFALTLNPTNMLADIRKQVDLTSGAVPFIDNYLLPHAKAYKIIKSKEWPHERNKKEIEHVLGFLDWLSHDEWMSSAMLGITTFDKMLENDGSRAPHDWILSFFGRLERFAYGLMIQGLSAYNRRRRYNPVRRALREPQSGRDALKELDLSTGEKKAIRNTLAHDLHRNRSQSARLVLLRLDQAASGRSPEFYNKEVAAEPFSVEHMLPRSPHEGTRWFALFPNDKERTYATEMLGNLFLVREKTENLRMKNYDFALKHEILFADKGDHPITLTHELRALRDWSSADIEARQKRLLTLADELWQLAV